MCLPALEGKCKVMSYTPRLVGGPDSFSAVLEPRMGIENIKNRLNMNLNYLERFWSQSWTQSGPQNVQKDGTKNK